MYCWTDLLSLLAVPAVSYLFVVFCLITATVEQSLATIDFAINTRAAANLMSWHVAGRSYSILSAFARLAYSANICRSSSLYILSTNGGFYRST